MTPQQARELLRRQPDLVRQLRERLAASGLTPDQIRARLRAAGYPEELLDEYLAGADTTRGGVPAPGTLDALRALGVFDETALDSLGSLDSMMRVGRVDSLVLDSLMRARADSLRRDSLADSLAAGRRKLKLFGVEVFRRVTTRFQPQQAGPVDERYRLGPGDGLVLILTGDVEVAHTLDVTREGFVVIPQVGQVYVANLTLGELRDQLYTRLGRVYSGVRRGPRATTQFQISVARLRTIQIYVVGDVVRPGAYQISGAGTMLTALYAAGGPTESGSFRRVEVRRGNTLVDSLDIYDYLLGGLNATDVRLQAGDVVFVPVRGGLVKVAGHVLRPAIYEVRPDETLSDVIRAAGGFEAQAVRRRVQIHRILPDAVPGANRVVIDVGADQFASGPVPPVPMFAGDSVTVFEIADRQRAFVTVRGNVWTEGTVGLTPGMRLSEAIRLAGGPRPDVYLDQILVTRVRPDSSRVQLRSAFRDSTGAVTDDLVLEEQDEVRVFARTAFRPTRYIAVVGAVRRPGRLVYREGMTLRDAVLFAGGVTEDADLREAEVARLGAEPASGALATTLRVPLDSTYLIERARGNGYSGPPGIPAAATGAPDVALQPYDNVLILRQPGWSLQRQVTLTGEVRAPGTYSLRSKTERLSDLLARAGGLTDEAYAGGIAYYRFRQLVREPEPANDRKPRNRAARTGRDSLDQIDSLRPFRERVGIDLPRVLRNARHRDNIILTAGDSIHIPEYEPVVIVSGDVNSPGPVVYSPGMNLDWYVRAAGGYSQFGDRKRAYVTQPNGKKESVQRRAILADGVPNPGPGAEIFVPTRVATEQNGTSVGAILGVAAQMLATLVTLIVVIDNTSGSGN